MTRISLVGFILGVGVFLLTGSPMQTMAQSPNIVIIFADDLGYGDLGCYGHPTLKTPNLDRLAAEGQKWTQFYSAASVCTPSRAALLTGRLPIRLGMCAVKPRVLFANSVGGLPADETTIAEALKKKGYATACVGKWHLGHLPRYLPTSRGFDSYLGIPYSNDMFTQGDSGKGVPLVRGTQVIEHPADQRTLTRRYTEEAVKFIKANREKPFFLYFPHTFPHTPLFASRKFLDSSLRGLYGDVVEELDWSVGEVASAVRELGLAEKTMIVFTSDNGPWMIRGLNGGSAGLLKGEKGSTWEGGMREPTIFWWPGRIRPGTVDDMGSTLDLFPTVMNLVGIDMPTDRTFDGYDLAPRLFGDGKSPRNIMYFYRGDTLFAVRKGPFKAHFFTQNAYGKDMEIHEHNPPVLYQLEHDPSSKHNVAKDHPDVIKDLKKEVELHKASVKPVVNQLTRKK